MCGGDASKPVREQEKYEQERLAKTNATAAAIRRAFDNPSRQAEIGDYEDATQKLYMRSFDRQHGDAARELKFAMARTGQGTGQVGVDKGAELTRQYGDGVLKITRAAKQAGARLRAADKDTEGRLIGMAQGGLDMTNTYQMALTGMRDNVRAAQAEAVPEGLGQAFAGLADTYQFSQEAKHYQRGYQQAATGNGTTPNWMSAYGAAPSGVNSTPSWMVGGGG